MRLYLDEDIASGALAQLLRNAGHDVQAPGDVGLLGRSNPVQDLLRLAGGHHPGILVVRRDNDPRRNMTPHDIVRAIRNLEAAGVPVADQYIILNPWQ
jgi:hypothetical protein